MSTVVLDTRRYQALLDEALPVVIKTHADYKRLLRIAESLMETPEEEISEEEGRLLELLSVLLEEYEDRTQPLPTIEPSKMLAYLLQQKAMRPADLASVLPKSRVSEILSGRRSISKSQAKQLAIFFRVPAEVFL